ncbi:13E12 repeat family protein, partial [Mycobacterium haemophilum]
MSSGGVVDREAITAAFDALDAAVDGVTKLNFDTLTTPEWLVLLERVERVRRRIPAVEHPMINQLARQATPEELGGTLSHAIAEWTLISRAEAAKRIREAA